MQYKKLDAVISVGIRRGHNLDYPVRGTLAAVFIKFILVADYGNIWLHIIFVIRVQEHGKSGG